MVGVAQLVERRIVVPVAEGSNPSTHPKFGQGPGGQSTSEMSKRLQVLLPDHEMSEIQRLAQGERMTVGEWVRRTLREARMRKPVKDSEIPRG